MRSCGTVSAYNGGCRCDECRRAASTTKRKQRERGDLRKQRHDYIQRLYAAGLGKPFVRRDGERLPCDGKTDLFFPDPVRRSTAEVAIAEAKALCATCPRQAECLELAVLRKEPAGVWGGVWLAEVNAPHIRGTDVGRIDRRTIPSAS